MPKVSNNIIDQLSNDIANTVGNTPENELDIIQKSFDDTLQTALKTFNSSVFNDDGFLKKMRDYDLSSNNDQDKQMMNNVLNNITNDYVNVQAMNQSELLLRRDIQNICEQMPEMRDVINSIRDAIIECNVASGEVSRTYSFEGRHDDDKYDTYVTEIEAKHNLLINQKNTIVPSVLRQGEEYIHVVPYAKLFAEIEAIHDQRFSQQKGEPSPFHESIPVDIWDSFKDKVSLNSDDNIKYMMEAAQSSSFVATNAKNDHVVHQNITESKVKPDEMVRSDISNILGNIDVYNGSSLVLAESGIDGLKAVLNEHKNNIKVDRKESHFMEAMGNNFGKVNKGIMAGIDQDGIDYSAYNDIKGCYIRYLDGLRLIPIRMDRTIIGYYYVSTTMDLQTNPAQPNGIVDLSYQNYTRDRNMVETLSNIIIKSFDKKVLEKNIKLKNEIANIIMAHKFSEGRLSFIYIPENEIVRIAIDEDENGRGHSVIEPSLFPARMYLMLTLYNMLYTLNNNTTRVHYVKSSGLDKNYASTVQRAMRKFQSRRITIDDIYSYSGVLNKVGGMGEMVLPSGRGDVKAIETDTIPAVEKPIDLEFLEVQRRQAISATGVPNLMIINAIDEIDFAKTLEMANSRFLSRVSGLKIDCNSGITKLYQLLLKYETDLNDDEIGSFRFKFNEVKQAEINITSEMIQNFNSIVELIGSIYYTKSDLEDKNGNPTKKSMILRKQLAKKYLGQFDFDELDKLIDDVDTEAGEALMQDKVNSIKITSEDLSAVEQ